MKLNSQLVGLSASLGLLCLSNVSPALAEQRCQLDNIPASTPTERFQIHADGTVSDKMTGLMWQRCLLGQYGDQCSSGKAVSMHWGELLNIAPQQATNRIPTPYPNWRLPNIRELASIVELQCANPAINLILFPNQTIAHSWSSSPYRFYDHYAWYLDFADGVFIYGDRKDKKQVRLVRDATP